ncbi:MAG: hypothetical protein AAF546_14545 [Verrucomicrobiota bacterium]
MKTIEAIGAQPDPVISEVRAIKREIVAEYGGDLDAFFAWIRTRQAVNPRLVKSIVGEQDGADQPATAPESKPEGKEKPQPEPEGRSQ